jgi:hypothetical protein
LSWWLLRRRKNGDQAKEDADFNVDDQDSMLS